MKKIFSSQDIPEVVISENGPQYASKEFKQFSDTWNFHHYTSSPHHPKGNGTSEAAVKKAKGILKRSQYPWMAILEHTTDVLASPNEKLNSRRTRTATPINSDLLEPHLIPTSQSVKKKQQNKRYYHRKANPLPPLVGECIRGKIKPQSPAHWTQGTVVRKENDRSYFITVDGRVCRRNRHHIRKSKEVRAPKGNGSDSALQSCIEPKTHSERLLPSPPPDK